MNSRLKHVYQFLKGQAPPKVQSVYMLCVTIIYILISVISQALFPESYSILRNTISNQGNSIINPQGYLIFNIGVFFIGFALIPHILFIMNHIRRTSKIIAYISAVFSVIGSISLSLLGVFPEEVEIPHLIVAGLAFIGFLLGALIMFIGFMERMLKRHSCGEVAAFTGLHVILVLSAIAISIFPLMAGVGDGLFGDGWFTSFTLWEWTLMISIVLWLLGMYLIILQLRKELKYREERGVTGNYFDDYLESHACFKKLALKKK